MSKTEELAELREIVLGLRRGIDAAKVNLTDEIIKWGLQCTIYDCKDMQGRYILADLYASYANVYVAWINLKEKHGTDTRGSDSGG
jgi:hypothetical protein